MTLLAVYLIFTLDYGNEAKTKSKSEQFSSLNSKWIIKQWRQCAPSTHLAQELLMNIYSVVMVQEVLQRRWEPWRWGEQLLAIGRWQWPVESIIRADPLKTTWEVAKELSVKHSMVIWHLKQVWKGEKLDNWGPHELTENQKKMSFLSVVFSDSTQQQWTIFQLDCDVWWKVDFIRQPAVTSSVARPRRSSKELPKAKLHQ